MAVGQGNLSNVNHKETWYDMTNEPVLGVMMESTGSDLAGNIRVIEGNMCQR